MLETITPVHTRKARKNHICDLCGSIINKSEVYEAAVFKYDGEIYQWKNHSHCGAISIALKMQDEEGVSSDIFCEYIDCEYFNLTQNTPMIAQSFKDRLQFVLTYHNISYGQK